MRQHETTVWTLKFLGGGGFQGGADFTPPRPLNHVLVLRRVIVFEPASMANPNVSVQVGSCNVVREVAARELEKLTLNHLIPHASMPMRLWCDGPKDTLFHAVLQFDTHEIKPFSFPGDQY